MKHESHTLRSAIRMCTIMRRSQATMLADKWSMEPAKLNTAPSSLRNARANIMALVSRWPSTPE